VSQEGVQPTVDNGGVVELEKQIGILSKEVERLNADNEALISSKAGQGEKVEELKQLLEEKSNEIKKLKAEVETLTLKLDEKSGAFKVPATKESLLEVVCVPVGPKVKVGAIKKGGVVYDPVFKKGFAHYLLPKSFACSKISGNEPGRAFYLVDGADSVVCNVYVGHRKTKYKTFMRHSLGEKKGKPTWLPVEIEDPNEKAAEE
jgi:uncharacterized coiled-coil protein SlyX